MIYLPKYIDELSGHDFLKDRISKGAKIDVNHLSKLPSIAWQQLKDTDRPSDTQVASSITAQGREKCFRATAPSFFLKALGYDVPSDEEEGDSDDSNNSEGDYDEEENEEEGCRQDDHKDNETDVEKMEEIIEGSKSSGQGLNKNMEKDDDLTPEGSYEFFVNNRVNLGDKASEKHNPVMVPDLVTTFLIKTDVCRR